MTSESLTVMLNYAEPVLCLITLASLIRARVIKDYLFLATLLGAKVAAHGIGWFLILYARKIFGPVPGYAIYFYFYWITFAVESILMLVVICSMYRLAMAPLKGLQSLGMLVFAWVGGISLLVALGASFAPHMTQIQYVVAFVSQMQRTQSILILCLLTFVCFAIRPMGLTYRSRIFGVSLGLGVMATTDLIQSAWISQVSTMFGTYTIIHNFAVCLTIATWVVYFVLPEPKRRLITLPTTSPFLRWNQISEVLGDNPGVVAIGGLPPDMLAAAEIEVMRRASLKMRVTWDTPPKPSELQASSR
jgi:hypothetical protein